MKKKIAVLATYVGSIHRGAETFVIELSQYLKAHYDIKIFSIEDAESLRDVIQKIEVNLPWLYHIHKKWYDINKLYRIICNKLYWLIPSEIYQYYFNKFVYEHYLLKEHFDLVFVNNGIWGAKFAHRLKQKRNIPFIVTGHGGIGKGENAILKECPDLYIALSDVQHNWAKQIYDKVVKIENGVNVSKFSLANIKKDPKLILIVAAFTKFKRHKLAIDAVSLLPDTKLLMLGKGELKTEIESYAKVKLGNRFEIKSVSYDEVIRYYHEAQVFTLPSEDEPFGIVYLEAMASGLPVVAPNDSVRQHIIGNAGILCDCTDVRTYANALERAMKKSWGDIPRCQAEKFDWDIISKKYIKFMDDII